MSSENVFSWIKRNKDLIGGRILEVGSREYQDHSSLKLRSTICRGAEVFVGCDIEAGENVDVVADMTADFVTVDSALGGCRFDTIFCISVLEHIPEVFAAARNILGLLTASGHLFVSVPFVFRFHGYPGDYWRFTPEAIEILFRGVVFDKTKPRAVMSTLTKSEIYAVGDDFGKRNRRIFRPNDLEARSLRKQQKAAINKGESSEAPEPYMLAPTMINMVGRKLPDGPSISTAGRFVPEKAE